MINRKLWLCIYISLAFLCYINTVKAETNYEALHLNHNIVAKYENGGLGYKAVGKDSYGGYSYGKWQISTKRSKNGLSTFDYFIQYIKNKNIIIYNKLQDAGGYDAAFCGKSTFINTWKKLADNKDFQILYDNFILDTHIIPVYKRLDANNYGKLTSWCSEDNIMQAALNSTIVQHGPGGAYNIIKNVFSENTIENKKNFLDSLYNYRIKKYSKYRRRYVAEYNDLIKNLKEEKQIKITKEISILDRLRNIFS
ncbi:MAG: hypothetical protein IKO49_02055 [Bacilli bacterium]|nr:hypothetical protein [Clostridia bacterium]MBR4618064.1 hypothetical protein [Bacilli bacterium]